MLKKYFETFSDNDNQTPPEGFEQIKEFVKNHFIYDVIIYFRIDILSEDIFSIPTIIENNTIYIPIGYDFEGGLNDQLAYGDYNSMKIYCNLYNFVESYNTHGIPYHPEILLKYHLNCHVVRIERFNYNYTLNKKRQDYDYYSPMANKLPKDIYGYDETFFI